jgi:hypothetical protein
MHVVALSGESEPSVRQPDRLHATPLLCDDGYSFLKNISPLFLPRQVC